MLLWLLFLLSLLILLLLLLCHANITICQYSLKPQPFHPIRNRKDLHSRSSSIPTLTLTSNPNPNPNPSGTGKTYTLVAALSYALKSLVGTSFEVTFFEIHGKKCYDLLSDRLGLGAGLAINYILILL
jgi:hypothetical protein